MFCRWPILCLIMIQHQCGLDGTPSIVHKTRPLKKYGTTHKFSSDRDNEDIIKNSIRKSKRKYFDDAQSCYSKIQAEEMPTFNKTFISPRIFLSKNCFFSALGKIIEESGGPHILNEFVFER